MPVHKKYQAQGPPKPSMSKASPSTIIRCFCVFPAMLANMKLSSSDTLHKTAHTGNICLEPNVASVAHATTSIQELLHPHPC